MSNQVFVLVFANREAQRNKSNDWLTRSCGIRCRTVSVNWRGKSLTQLVAQLYSRYNQHHLIKIYLFRHDVT